MDELLAHASERVKNGDVSGLLVVMKLGDRQHGIGMLGDYLADPAEVLPVTSRISYRANQLIDAQLRKPKGGKVADFENR
jgi:hypothetical protein